jgi:alkylation response protein AidB-like acyl-CoA dehydrogenase
VVTFELTEEQRIIQRTVGEWAEEDLWPRGPEMEEKRWIPDEVYDEAADLGLLGLVIPEEYGGSGLDTLAACLALGEVAKGDSSVALSLLAHNSIASENVVLAGTEEQKEEYLPKLAQGEYLGAWGLTEPGAGSDALGIETRAEKDGDEWVINGTKCFITNGSRADVVMVTTRSDEGYTVFIVESDTEGFSASRDHDLVCNKASDTSYLHFDDCRVPDNQRLGEPGMAIQNTLRCLDLERVMGGAMLTAGAEKSLDLALEYTKQREAFGGPIAQKQNVYSKLARLSTRVEASEGLWMKAARKRDRGENYSKAGAQAKLFASELAQDAAQEAVQLHGGAGLERENRVERAVRDSLLGTIGGGTSAMQEVVIARGLGIDVNPYT